jgi:hypothetical protein
MLIIRKSIITNITHEMEIDVTQEQLVLWKSGMPIQKAMPNLSFDEREFIKTGITREEWQRYIENMDDE